MNRMVRQLQPDILINNRSGIPEDFTTPEQHIQASAAPWEACMTMNDSWGYHRADDNWKSPKTIVKNLLQCTRDQGNYLLNIGPQPDGSVPEESVGILTHVGKWMDTHAELIHKADRCKVRSSELAQFTRQGNTLFIHAYYWPGETLALGGLQQKCCRPKCIRAVSRLSSNQRNFACDLWGCPVRRLTW
jgi:alpha-L-fucosidase